MLDHARAHIGRDKTGHIVCIPQVFILRKRKVSRFVIVPDVNVRIPVAG